MNPIYRFLLYTDTDNLFSPSLPDTLIGVSMAWDGWHPTSMYNTSGKITVTPGDMIRVSNVFTLRCFDQYDSPLNYLWNENREMDFIVPENTVYMRVCVFVDYWSGLNVYKMQQAHPVYKEDLAKEYELETNQQFYRTRLSGKLSFIRQDYDYIAFKPMQSQLYFSIGKSNDNGVTWDDNYFLGKFFKTDCEFNADDKICTVQPDTLDQYDEVLAGIENEYNLITLAPKIERLAIAKRPLIQVYVPGDSVVSCFLTGMYWEQDANVIYDPFALLNTYKFRLCNLLKDIQVWGTSSPDVSGSYYGRMSMATQNEFTGILYRTGGGDYYIRAYQRYIAPYWGTIVYEMVRASDGVSLFSFNDTSHSETPFDSADFDFTPISSGASGSPHANMSTTNIYARYLLDVATLQGNPTYPIPTDDIVDNNRNYQRIIPYPLDVAYISKQFSGTPTEWGLADNGQYFLPPDSLSNAYFPIARSTWRYSSFWFGFANFDWYLEEQGRREYTLRDAYTVASCIQVLLNQFAPGIKHEATTEYSQFLYTPNSSPLGTQAFTLMVSQKTNVLFGNYDRPAQKAITTLQQFTNMLRDCFRCFWYIEDNKFKIEHILFFRNGGSYSVNPNTVFDLTTFLNVRNRKSWAFASSKWSFDKVDLAERYQFEWMDDVTRAFNGYPIEILSKFVTRGKIEEITVANFTSDVDYMMLNPGTISNDGFALFAAVIDNKNINTGVKQMDGTISPDNGQFVPTGTTGEGWYATDYIKIVGGGSYRLSFKRYSAFYDENRNYISGEYQIGDGGANIIAPMNAYYLRTTGLLSFDPLIITRNDLVLPFGSYVIDRVNYILQNYILSFGYIQPAYYVYDLSARMVRINNNERSAIGVERKKKQTISYPSIDDPDPNKLIKTEIGTGQIDKISINLHSRLNNITLKYDTE